MIAPAITAELIVVVAIFCAICFLAPAIATVLGG